MCSGSCECCLCCSLSLPYYQLLRYAHVCSPPTHSQGAMFSAASPSNVTQAAKLLKALQVGGLLC